MKRKKRETLCLEMLADRGGGGDIALPQVRGSKEKTLFLHSRKADGGRKPAPSKEGKKEHQLYRAPRPHQHEEGPLWGKKGCSNYASQWGEEKKKKKEEGTEIYFAYLGEKEKRGARISCFAIADPERVVVGGGKRGGRTR